MQRETGRYREVQGDRGIQDIHICTGIYRERESRETGK